MLRMAMIRSCTRVTVNITPSPAQSSEIIQDFLRHYASFLPLIFWIGHVTNDDFGCVELAAEQQYTQTKGDLLYGQKCIDRSRIRKATLRAGVRHGAVMTCHAPPSEKAKNPPNRVPV